MPLLTIAIGDALVQNDFLLFNGRTQAFYLQSPDTTIWQVRALDDGGYATLKLTGSVTSVILQDATGVAAYQFGIDNLGVLTTTAVAVAGQPTYLLLVSQAGIPFDLTVDADGHFNIDPNVRILLTGDQLTQSDATRLGQGLGARDTLSMTDRSQYTLGASPLQLIFLTDNLSDLWNDLIQTGPLPLVVGDTGWLWADELDSFGICALRLSDQLVMADDLPQLQFSALGLGVGDVLTFTDTKQHDSLQQTDAYGVWANIARGFTDTLAMSDALVRIANTALFNDDNSINWADAFGLDAHVEDLLLYDMLALHDDIAMSSELALTDSITTLRDAMDYAAGLDKQLISTSDQLVLTDEFSLQWSFASLVVALADDAANWNDDCGLTSYVPLHDTMTLSDAFVLTLDKEEQLGDWMITPEIYLYIKADSLAYWNDELLAEPKVEFEAADTSDILVLSDDFATFGAVAGELTDVFNLLDDVVTNPTTFSDSLNFSDGLQADYGLVIGEDIYPTRGIRQQLTIHRHGGDPLIIVVEPHMADPPSPNYTLLVEDTNAMSDLLGSVRGQILQGPADLSRLEVFGEIELEELEVT